MDEYDLYTEKVSSKWVVVIYLIIAVCLPIIPFMIYLSGEHDGLAITTAIYIPLSLVLLATAYNFSSIGITITDQNIEISFGIFKHKYAWDDISEYHKEESGMFKNGGYGIRTVRKEGRWRRVYNVAGGSIIVLVLRSGNVKEFAFSTNDPDEIIRVLEKKIS